MNDVGSGGARRGVAGIAFGLSVATFAAFQQFKLPVVLPVMIERYGYDRVMAGGFMSVFAVSGLLLSMRVGRTIEHRGAGRPVLAALAILAAGILLTLAAPERQLVVLAGRALEGIAFTVMAIAGPVVASANATPRQLPVVLGLMATWIPVGQLLATGLAPLALAWADWQMLWWIALGGTAALGWWTARVRAVGVAPPVEQPARTNAPPGAPGAPGAEGTLRLGAMLFVLWSAQFIGFATWLPQYLVEARGVPLAGALQAYVLSAAMVMAGNLGAGLAMRAGAPLQAVLLAGLVAQTGPWWFGHGAESEASAAALLVLFSFGAGLVPACLFGVPNALGGVAARGFATLLTGRNLGVLVGPVLLAKVVEMSGDWSAVGAVFGSVSIGCVVLGAALALRLRSATACA